MKDGHKVLELYVDRNGEEPFTVWLESLRDSRTRYRVVARLDRLSLGNPGDHKVLGGGMFELRLQFGPGYRVYCGEVEETIILLLVGGDKGTQNKDIARAREHWNEYREGRK